MTAAYDLGGTTIHPCRLNIRSVKVVPTPTAATVPTGGGALLGSADGYSTTTEVSTQPTATLPTWRPRLTPTHLWNNLQWQWQGQHHP